MTYCLIPVSIAASVGLGLALLLYGRNRLLRSTGVLLSSVLGPAIAWVAGRFLFRTVGEQLLGREPRVGDVYIIGEDITLNELLWLPLQNAGFCVFIIVTIILVMWLFSSRRGIYASSTLEDFLYDLSLDRLLNSRRKGARLGWLAYQVVTGLSILFALPVMGLIAYATLQILSIGGKVFVIGDWINWSIFGACVLFAILYLVVNEATALRD